MKDMLNMHHEHNLGWIDLELTGLNTKKDTIIEIASVVTDKELNILEEGPNLIVHHEQSTLDKIDPKVKKLFSNSERLLKEVLESRVSMREAETLTLTFLKKYIPEKKSPLCGNSVGYDRYFLHKDMPELENFFHYRNIDVSTLKELFHRWKPSVLNKVHKKEKHRARADILESIEELKIYKKIIS